SCPHGSRIRTCGQDARAPRKPCGQGCHRERVGMPVLRERRPGKESLARGANGRGIVPPAQPRRPRRGIMAKVLVVDDQENIVRLLELALGDEHQVITAYNGEQAMEAVRRDRPDVVVLDIIMPVLDGYRVLHRLKSDPETQDITVIMLTQ